ncbi:flavin reductase [Acidipropionibacterium jensenii]|uniref:Flavin reductase n=1 Tax=Acidipropionibacterium jensenii TaxID=1749 RepID=A0A3T0S196_9ACTN|nr:flavin reductase family protein [Acidipropionibacterium jensenii]AZZ40129.1 flavin reductase [Acidipropionibacterium jensenii]
MSHPIQESDLAQELAGVFRQYPAGAAVLTARGAAGPVGMTVSSLASVSVRPAMVSLSMGHGSITLAALEEGSRVVLHPLEAGQEQLGNEFAHHGISELRTRWMVSPEQVPCLDVPTARLHCEVVRLVDVGSATVVVLEVDRIEPGRRGHDALVWMGRRWRTIPR